MALINLANGGLASILGAESNLLNVVNYGVTLASAAGQDIITKYQGIFDLIEIRSLQGQTSIDWTLSINGYNELLYDLNAAGYTVTVVKKIKPHWVSESSNTVTARIYTGGGTNLWRVGTAIKLEGWSNPNGTAVLNGNYAIVSYTEVSPTALSNVVSVGNGVFTIDAPAITIKQGMTIRVTEANPGISPYGISGAIRAINLPAAGEAIGDLLYGYTYTITSVASQTRFTIGALAGVPQSSLTDLASKPWSITRDTEIQFTTTGTVGRPIIPGTIYGVAESSWVSTVTNTYSQIDIKISWPGAYPTVYPDITAISPTSILGNQNIYFSQTFSVTGGTGPYTYSVSGTLPTGLSWSTLTNVTTITLAGTPVQLGSLTPGFTVTATDSQGKTLSQAVSWTVSNSSVITINTQSAGANALSYNPNTGALTFTPYLLPATTTSTLGAVIIPSVTASGINNSSGTLTLATASTTQLGALRVDGVSIQVTDGVASIPSTTTVLDARIKSLATAIAFAAAVAFGV